MSFPYTCKSKTPSKCRQEAPWHTDRGAASCFSESGASIPSETMMHFPPLFQIFPIFLENFRTLRKIFTILPFPDKFLDFHPPQFLMTYFSHRPQISKFPPIFPVSIHLPPSVSRKLLFPPYFDKFSLCFRQIHLLFTYFTCISFPPLL